MITIKQIAKICNVSTATVSKALNDYDDISQATKDRILKTAKDLGYLPNSAAKSMKTDKTFNIGVLYQDEANSGLTHEYFSHILEAFKLEVEKHGYDLTFINKNNSNFRQMTYLEHCRYRNFDGVMIACINFDDPEVEELINSSIPLVTIDHVSENTNAVVSNNYQGIKDLIEYAYALGHRKIAYIYGDKASDVTTVRLNSFKETLAKLGVHVPKHFLRASKYLDSDAAAQITKELLSLETKPSCILYSDDYSALGGISAIREMGLSIPNDISVAGYDGLSLSRVVSPTLTTVKQDVETMGSLAGEILLASIKNEEADAKRIMVDGLLQKGNTVAPIK